MIVVDTSALMALLLGEAQAHPVAATLESAEAMIVAERLGVGAELARLVEGLGIEVDPVTAPAAARAAQACGR